MIVIGLIRVGGFLLRRREGGEGLKRRFIVGLCGL